MCSSVYDVCLCVMCANMCNLCVMHDVCLCVMCNLSDECLCVMCACV